VDEPIGPDGQIVTVKGRLKSPRETSWRLSSMNSARGLIALK
jgi:hypothetical protein